MGPRYISSYNVLLIILIPTTLYYAQTGSNRILFGTSQHKALAYIALIEGLANVILVVLVRPFGIVGDAIGTAIPLTCTALMFCRVTCVACSKFRLGDLLRQLTFILQSFASPWPSRSMCMQQFSYAQLSTAHCQSACRLGSLHARGALVCAHA